MINFRSYAETLLKEYDMCCHARTAVNAVDIQIEKDSCAKFATVLNNNLVWGSDNDIAEACYQLEPRLKKLKEKLIIDVLSS